MRLSISNGLSISGQQTGSAGGGGGAEAVSFGALTLAGAGGVAKPAGATAISDAGGTNLVLSSGFAVPDTGGTVTSGTVVWDDGTEWTVTAVANTYSAKCDKTEIEAVHAAAPLAATSICSVREGTTAEVLELTGKTFTGSFTLIGEGFSTNSAARPSGYTWGAQVGGIVMSGEEIHIDGMEVYAPKGGARANQNAVENATGVELSNFSVKRCHVYSTSMEQHVEEMLVAGDPQVALQVGGFNFYGEGVNGVVEDCFVHDTQFVLKSGVDNMLVQGVESEDTVEGWMVNGCKGGTVGLVIKHCEHMGMWASIDDPGDQHSGMGGGDGQLGFSNKGKLIGCVVSNAGWRRRDYEASQGRTTYYPYGVGGSAIDMTGTTGFKLNDPNPKTANGYDGWEIKHNLFLCESGAGMTVENGKNIDWAYNTLVGDAESGNGAPTIYADDQEVTGTFYTDSGPLRAWKNISGAINFTGLHTEAERIDAGLRAYDNIQVPQDGSAPLASGNDRYLTQYFNGHSVKGFAKLTPSEMVEAFTPKTGTWADLGNVGAINDYMTIGIPGKGTTDTSPAYDQPTSAGSATANGYAYPRTVWDGTVGLELSSDATHGTTLTTAPNTLVPNGKEILIVGQIEVGIDGTLRLYEDGTGGITLSRSSTYDGFSLNWNRASDNTPILNFQTLYECFPSTGMFAFALSADLANDRVCMAVDGKAVTGFHKIASGKTVLDDVGDWQANNVHLLEDTAGGNRFQGKLDFFGVKNAFVDLETDAGLETIFAADGTLLDLRSSNFLIALTGNAAAFNSGNPNAGLSQAVTKNGGTVTDDATVPDAFVDANWSVATGSGANELDVTIASLPSDGGATITDVEYDVDAGGSWTSLPSYAGTGTYTISMAAPSTSYAIRLRAVNSAGNAAAGNSESATSGAAASNVDEGSSTASFTTSGGFRVAELTNGETLVVSTGFTPTGIEMVGGGGGGGGRIGGGGGAGELIQKTTGVPALTAQTYTATVGAGGAWGSSGSNGGNTRLIGGTSDNVALTALGGGLGATTTTPPDGANGGSGGGATAGTTSDGGLSIASDGVGNNGANGVSGGGGTGGGGAGGAGTDDGGAGTGGTGGAGVTSIAPGFSDTLAKGGDGGPQTGTSAVAATGIGTGGNGGSGTFGQRDGSDGTSGIIRVWWPV